MYYIYQILLYDKIVYIGRTNNPQARWNYHKTHETNTLLKRYFATYGIDNFQFHVIYSDLTYAQAKALETQLIAEESQTNFYLANSDIGDKKSFYIRDKISNSCKAYWNSAQSEYIRKKLANTSKNRKAVFDPQTNQQFKSVTEAAQMLNISRNAIYYRLQHNLMQYI